MPGSSPTSLDAQAPNIEVWNDLVSARDLLVCLVVSAVSAVVALGIAIATGGQLLFWGLGGCVLGFVINCFLVRPKREVRIVEDMQDASEKGAGQ
ncbi:hypothetical protein [Actinomyces sp. MRS3W]|uniref:hypothetical protein n=1 Tax=Actinomyces sp. MRS3W TaxID=2800796 RepID=UPI0028FD39B3|nr:hypothetical protein [Actinomyces sp. MRS3W]MDU0348064.1 hypothetical protein [Actinomyces sp. MRS3W]